MQCTDYKSDNYITLIITLKVYITNTNSGANTAVIEQISNYVFIYSFITHAYSCHDALCRVICQCVYVHCTCEWGAQNRHQKLWLSRSPKKNTELLLKIHTYGHPNSCTQQQHIVHIVITIPIIGNVVYMSGQQLLYFQWLHCS